MNAPRDFWYILVRLTAWPAPAFRRCAETVLGQSTQISTVGLWKVTSKMRKLALFVVLSSLLAGCTTSQMNMLTGKRSKTYNDISASWIDSSEEQLISRWGPPKKSYTFESGAKIISYEDIWGPISAYHVCEQKFLIEKGVVTKWGISNCPARVNGTLPNNTPIPQPTL